MTDKQFHEIDLPSGWNVITEEEKEEEFTGQQGMSALYKHENGIDVDISHGMVGEKPSHRISVRTPDQLPERELEWRSDEIEAKAVAVAFMRRYNAYRKISKEKSLGWGEFETVRRIIDREEKWNSVP
jgi:hypothetical protein